MPIYITALFTLYIQVGGMGGVHNAWCQPQTSESTIQSEEGFLLLFMAVVEQLILLNKCKQDV